LALRLVLVKPLALRLVLVKPLALRLVLVKPSALRLVLVKPSALRLVLVKPLALRSSSDQPQPELLKKSSCLKLDPSVGMLPEHSSSYLHQ
jgi:hypothetical protein